IHSDNGVDQNYARIFCFASFFRVRRGGDVKATGRATPVDASAECSAPCAATFTRTESTTGAAADTAAFTSANAATTAGTVGHVDRSGEGITEIGERGIGDFQIWGSKQSGFRRKLRIR